jgi:hypothetical protein
MSEVIANIPGDELAALEEGDISISIKAGSIGDVLAEEESSTSTTPEALERRERVKEAIERSRSRIPRQAPPQRHRSVAERGSAELSEKTKQVLQAEFGVRVTRLLRMLDRNGRLEQGLGTVFNLSNGPSLDLLRENGYISEEMQQAQQINLPALMALQILADKNQPDNLKRHLLGPSGSIAKEVFSAEVEKYFLRRTNLTDESMRQ